MDTVARLKQTNPDLNYLSDPSTSRYEGERIGASNTFEDTPKLASFSSVNGWPLLPMANRNEQSGTPEIRFLQDRLNRLRKTKMKLGRTKQRRQNQVEIEKNQNMMSVSTIISIYKCIFLFQNVLNSQGKGTNKKYNHFTKLQELFLIS